MTIDKGPSLSQGLHCGPEVPRWGFPHRNTQTTCWQAERCHCLTPGPDCGGTYGDLRRRISELSFQNQPEAPRYHSSCSSFDVRGSKRFISCSSLRGERGAYSPCTDIREREAEIWDLMISNPSGDASSRAIKLNELLKAWWARAVDPTPGASPAGECSGQGRWLCR